MSDELKPCQFCHGKSELDTMHSYYNNKGDVVNASAIDCVNCEAHMSICYEDVPDMGIDDVVNELTAKWNTRALCPETLEASLLVVDDILVKYAVENRYLCCSGYECGCLGATNHDEIKHYFENEVKQKIRNLKGES